MLIDILLATYNGENFLEEQIDSILSQTYLDWNLIIRDDDSDDRTLSIIENFKKKYPEKIFLINDDKNQIGASKNFGKLLDSSSSDYIFLSDQDDIWLPTKIEMSLKKIQNLESKYGSATKLLVHTDMRVVDENLNKISDSFWRYQNLNPENGNLLKRLLVQNVITGCSIVLNKSLKNFACPIPTEAIMHDWWLSLVAVNFGKIEYINEPTVLYRQHSKNDVGAKKWGINYFISRALKPGKIHNYFNKTIIQSEKFLDRYEHLLNSESFILLRIYSDLRKYNFFEKRFLLVKHGYYKVGDPRNLGLFLFI